MSQISQSPRRPSELSPSLQKRLSTYLAAGAGLAVLAPQAAGEIIFTPADAVIGRNGSYNLRWRY
jgi:hypothetical protein